MTDKEKFLKVVKGSGKKIYEVAAALGMSSQSLRNKLGNVTQFTQAEISKFKELFPNVPAKELDQIFFADK